MDRKLDNPYLSLPETEERQLMLRLERLAHLEGLRVERRRIRIPDSIQASLDSRAYDSEVIKKDGSTVLEGPFTFKALGSEPDDPEDDCGVMWLSNGMGSGDIGDIMIKVTVEGITKTAVLVDFSDL